MDEDWFSKYQPANKRREGSGPYVPPSYPVHGPKDVNDQPKQLRTVGAAPGVEFGPTPPTNFAYVEPIGGGGALACGVLSWIPMLGFLGIVAILLGISALRRAGAQNVVAPPLPLAGIITGAMGVGSMLLLLVAYFIF